MNTDICVPALPESVSDATVLNWYKNLGDQVIQGENLVDLETDKVILEVPAPIDGILDAVQFTAGAVVKASQVLGIIKDIATPSKSENLPSTESIIAPAARRLVNELGIDSKQIIGTGKDGRILKADVMTFLDKQENSIPRDDLRAFNSNESASSLDKDENLQRTEQRVPMTRLRARIAERLVQAQHTAAILTTVNEIDMHAVLDLRAKYKDAFEQKYQVRLGFMAFFVKAAVEALQRFPIINAAVDNNDIIYHNYYDIGVAISSSRGLVVPILRDCNLLSFAVIEQRIAEFARQAKDGALSYEDLTGGTFSITNGGVFGSLLSTPIINPPQSAILGMHAIKERVMVINGQMCIRSMMYVALSYDHRIIDGRDAVQFLFTIKDIVEDPIRLLLQV
jgi:2-oxoglutarate dehydrogenase E2 component (dihydrolipoamide succinyltransferase)